MFLQFKMFGESKGSGVQKDILPNYPTLKSIEGRLQDYIISKTRALVPVAPLLYDYNFDLIDLQVIDVHHEEHPLWE